MQCFLKNRDKGDFEKWFPYHNWILVLSLQLVLSTIWAVITPSIYQYITTPQSLPAELSQNTSTRTWPGLGGSDTDYAWALTFPPLCEFAVFPLALWMTRRVPFTVPLLIGVSLLVVSGTMYALSGDVWVLMISRGVMGMGGGLSIPALHTYMGEMGTVMDQVREKQGKKPRKFAVYIAFSFIMSGGFVIAFGEYFINVCAV
jgi:MFS family permease